MSLKKQSPAAYNDVKFVMELAVEKPGLKYVSASAGKAINFKQRCNRYRNLLREIAAESMIHVPGQRGATLFDILVIRQVNAEGESDRKGAVLIFDHERADGQIFDPETGEEILIGVPAKTGLFDVSG